MLKKRAAKHPHKSNQSKYPYLIGAVLIIWFAFIGSYILQGNLPSQLSPSTASTILTTVIGIESLLVGFVVVAYFFICQEYSDYYGSATTLSMIFKGLESLELPEEIKKHTKSLGKYMENVRDKPKQIRSVFFINFVLICGNIFYMLLLLFMIDPTQEFVPGSLSSSIYNTLFTLALNMGLVGLTLLLNSQFTESLGQIKMIEKMLDLAGKN